MGMPMVVAGPPRNMVMQLVGLLLFVFVFTLISFDQRTISVSVACFFCVFSSIFRLKSGGVKPLW